MASGKVSLVKKNCTYYVCSDDGWSPYSVLWLIGALHGFSSSQVIRSLL
jgi:hypothetical protein